MKEMGNPVANTTRVSTHLNYQMTLFFAAINQSDGLRSWFCQTNHHTVKKNASEMNPKK